MLKIDGIAKFFKSLDLRKVAKIGAGLALASGATALTVAGVKAANGDESPEYQTLGGEGCEENANVDRDKQPDEGDEEK